MTYIGIWILGISVSSDSGCVKLLSGTRQHQIQGSVYTSHGGSH